MFCLKNLKETLKTLHLSLALLLTNCDLGKLASLHLSLLFLKYDNSILFMGLLMGVAEHLACNKCSIHGSFN